MKDTGVVGVTFNYRLGVFGYLRTPALAAEDPDAGYCGFEDQQAALRWVQRNVARFGGAPSHVTIDGQSAGASAVCGHLTSPGSRGLFAAAMIESGSCGSVTPAVSEQRGQTLVTVAGCMNPATVPGLPSSSACGEVARCELWMEPRGRNRLEDSLATRCPGDRGAVGPPCEGARLDWRQPRRRPNFLPGLHR